MPHDDYYEPPNPQGPQAPTASNTKIRYTSGIPPQFIPGRIDCAGSAPARSNIGAAAHNDYYRNSLIPYQVNGKLKTDMMISATPFKQRYEEYKKLDCQGAEENKKVNAYNKTAQPALAKKKSSDASNSGKYAGDPFESDSWHQGVAQLKQVAGDAWQRASNARNNMGQDYIGYDDQKSYQGHQQRAKKCLKLAGDNHRAVSRHNGYFDK